MAIKPLREKRAHQDDVVKRVPVKPKWEEYNVENTMEICHYCLFHVFIRGYSHHCSSESCCFCLLPLFSSSVKTRMMFKPHVLYASWCICQVCFHWTWSCLNKCFFSYFKFCFVLNIYILILFLRRLKKKGGGTGLNDKEKGKEKSRLTVYYHKISLVWQPVLEITKLIKSSKTQ